MQMSKPGFLEGSSPRIAIPSLAIIAVFVFVGVAFTESAGSAVSAVNDWVLSSLRWYYIGTISIVTFFIMALLCTRYANIRLGDDGDRPEFSNFAWLAMIFSAGVGIGLLFWGVAEPIYHFQDNPFIDEAAKRTPEAAQVAMRITIFHWGLGGWATYVIVGLALAYFAYRKRLPLTIRSALYPIIGERIYGPIGDAVDVLAVFATVFGVATTLGLGVSQLHTALDSLAGTSTAAAGDISSLSIQAALALILTALAIYSVVTGVHKGIKYLSVANMLLTVVMLTIFLVAGPTRELLRALVTNTGDYLAEVAALTVWVDPDPASKWQNWWTTFYWGWWIAWAPFIGLFIARISRGRTVREFILGVLVIPTALCIVWMTMLGNTALHIELLGAGGIVEAVQEDVTLALFTTFEKMDLGPWMPMMLVLSIMLIVVFFVTGADSAMLALTTILGRGNLNPPIGQLVFWGSVLGLSAVILLLGGGLKALQTASIIGGMPFATVMLIMVYGLLRSFRQESVGPQFTEDPVIALKSAAEAGDLIAQTKLAELYEGAALQSQAQSGDSTAQVQLASVYADKDIIEHSHAEAAKWFRMAAEQGVDVAQNRLGLMYLTGQGVARNHKEGIAWVRKAADAGYDGAQVALGVLHVHGYGVKRDFSEARRWYQMAADQGNHLAVKYLSRLPQPRSAAFAN
ncbi:MAG: BCCT family transporter [Gammaproteobacteria bacterium]